MNLNDCSPARSAQPIVECMASGVLGPYSFSLSAPLPHQSWADHERESAIIRWSRRDAAVRNSGGGDSRPHVVEAPVVGFPDGTDSRDRVQAVAAYPSGTSVAGYGQLNGFEFVFEVCVLPALPSLSQRLPPTRAPRSAAVRRAADAYNMAGARVFVARPSASPTMRRSFALLDASMPVGGRVASKARVPAASSRCR